MVQQSLHYASCFRHETCLCGLNIFVRFSRVLYRYLRIIFDRMFLPSLKLNYMLFIRIITRMLCFTLKQEMQCQSLGKTLKNIFLSKGG
ncbi:MAG: hypothetical protein PWQ75_2153 [Methanolobus sp.]|jgi:hypothetical protein|nr:hypothetical protein [Methanolobus sp.]